MKKINLACSMVLLVIGTLAACASEPDAPKDDAPIVITRDGDASPTQVTAPPPLVALALVDAGGDAADAAPACGALANTACLTCCDLAYPQMAAAMTAAIAQCACLDPGECATECRTSFCAGKPASAACATCIQKANTCAPATATVCAATPACTTYMSCLTSCAKP